MISLGIDPGRDGAAVLIEAHGRDLVVLGSLLWHDVCPKGWDPVLVRDALLDLFRDSGHVRPDVIVLEKIAGRPGEGSVSSRTMGLGWGVLWSVCALTWGGVDLLTPTPQRWQAVLKDRPGDGKARAISLVSHLLPGLDLTPGRRRVPHDGLADAGAMAVWGTSC